MADVISKMMQLLHALAPNEDENERSATQISRELNIPVQTVHRLLLSMTKSGLVYQNKETRKFRLGMTLMQFGFMVWDNISVRTTGKPFMKKLSKKTGASVYLTIREGVDGIFVDSVYPSPIYKSTEPIGMRLPLHIGASKKVILAFLKEKLQNQILDDLSPLPARTKSTITNREKLQIELIRIRQQGYAISYGETTEGTVGLAAPIFSWDNQIIGSISIAGYESSFIKENLPRLVHAVKQSGSDISEELGWLPQKREWRNG